MLLLLLQSLDNDGTVDDPLRCVIVVADTRLEEALREDAVAAVRTESVPRVSMRVSYETGFDILRCEAWRCMCRNAILARRHTACGEDILEELS
jgi:hypothetical protein